MEFYRNIKIKQPQANGILTTKSYENKEKFKENLKLKNKLKSS